MNAQILWFIDEDEAQLRTYTAQLRECVAGAAEVHGIVPYRYKQDYIEPVINNPATVSLIIDQRLKDTGIATYDGIELAQYLRGINTKLPIYILTNYADSEAFAGAEWSIEYIIPKSDFGDSDKKRTVCARILRHIAVYRDILDSREARFHDLLEKSLAGTITTEEVRELNSIESSRALGVAAAETQQLAQLEDIVKRHKELLDSFKNDLKREE